MSLSESLKMKGNDIWTSPYKEESTVNLGMDRKSGCRNGK